jgi:hypothetical protein
MQGLRRFCLTACAGATIALTASPALADPPFVRGRVLVKFRDGTDEQAKGQAIAAARGRNPQDIPGANVKIITVNNGDESFVARIMSERPEVEFAELDQLHEPAGTPNDPFFINTQTSLQRIQCPTAWDLNTGSSSVIIAILDSGIQSNHPDLASKLVPGRNVTNSTNQTEDTFGHGTMVAGTAAASTNNGIGIAGVAWGCRLMPIKITPDGSTLASTSAIAAGLDWARQNGARVANVSYRSSESATVRSAAQTFVGAGGVVSIAAGNDRTYVSNADNPYVITVTGLDYNDNCIANYGNIIDLAAPMSTYTTGTNSTYGATSGTSLSAPMVAGVAALVISANPSLSGQRVMDLIYQSVDDLGAAGWDQQTGWGRVNARRALELAMGTSPTVDTTPPSVAIMSPSAGGTVGGQAIVQAAASDNVAVASVALTINGQPAGSDASAPYEFSVSTASLPNGTYTLVATAVDTANNSNSTSSTIEVYNPPVDTVAPVVTITSPASGALVTGLVGVTCNATDNVGVVRAELYVDGSLITRSTTPPFTMKWNARKAARGPHSIVVKAYDGRDNMGVSSAVSVTR